MICGNQLKSAARHLDEFNAVTLPHLECFSHFNGYRNSPPTSHSGDRHTLPKFPTMK